MHRADRNGLRCHDGEATGSSRAPSRSAGDPIVNILAPARFATSRGHGPRTPSLRRFGLDSIIGTREVVVPAVSERPDLFVELMDQSGWLLVGVSQDHEGSWERKGPS